MPFAYTKTGNALTGKPALASSFIKALGEPVASTGAEPTITNITPSTGSLLTSSSNIEFDVNVPDLDMLASLVLVVKYADSTLVEAAYDHVLGFFPNFQTAQSAVTAITGGFHFSISRIGGWQNAPSFLIRAITDKGGINI